MNTKYPKYLEEGDTYNRLTVICVDEISKASTTKPSDWKYICKCDCGSIVSVMKRSLCSGGTKSCGCYHKDILKKNMHYMHEANKKVNFIKIEGDISKVYFRNTNRYTLVDTDNIDKIKNHCWGEHGSGYAYTNNRIGKGVKNRVTLLLHRMLLDVSGDTQIDHINGNRLDNRECNLRTCTKATNARNRTLVCNNTSGSSGVTWLKGREMWEAYITINKRWLYLGAYRIKQDAIDARHEAEIKYFGEFAPHICRGVTG